MLHGIIVTDNQLEAAYCYLDELYKGFDINHEYMSDAEKLAKIEAYSMWRGARRMLRRLGIKGADLDRMFEGKEANYGILQ